ncbi:hypothetical protein GOV07_03560, partial [Candidatus Woesearchaeota archaeon]|nr:hypothetical protein [Candidatus Woesearchaeota archaeon]
NLGKDRATLKLKSKKKHYEPYKGGISGPVIKAKALALITHIKKRTGKRFVLVGCGGISTAEDAFVYILAGASLVQLLTGMIYHGPATVKEINKGLVTLLEQAGYRNLASAVGAGTKRRAKN